MIFESVSLSLVLSMSRQAAATVMAELRQKPALLRVLRKRNSSGKASSDAGPELAGRVAVQRWKARFRSVAGP